MSDVLIKIIYYKKTYYVVAHMGQNNLSSIIKNYFAEADSPFNIALFRIIFFLFVLTKKKMLSNSIFRLPKKEKKWPSSKCDWRIWLIGKYDCHIWLGIHRTRSMSLPMKAPVVPKRRIWYIRRILRTVIYDCQSYFWISCPPKVEAWQNVTTCSR